MNNILISIFSSYFMTATVVPQGQPEIIARDTQNIKIIKIAVIGSATYITGLAILNFTFWHNNDKLVPFHFYNDNKADLQIDKLFHSFSSYVESSIGYCSLQKAGFTETKALIIGGSMGFLIQTPKEFLDGFYTPGGFSWGDMIANGAGSAFFIGQQLLFHEQVLKYKSSFSRSKYSEISHGYLGNSILENYFYDYNGHTYWISVNANKLLLKDKIPSWISLALGYSANGMIGHFSNIHTYNGQPIPEIPRYRQYLLSFDVDWTKINTRSKLLKIIFQGLNYIKIPFPALEYNSLGKWKGYWLYF